MRRAVLDTNVIVSGLITSKGTPADLLTAWRNRRFDLVIGPAILQEIERVLRLPRITKAYRLAPQDISGLVELLTSRAVLTPGRLAIPSTARDPEDDQILACAIEGHADYIVTGDQDLLILERFQGIPIIPPAAFAAVLRTAR
ncbi:MAG: putative toxin-antitoxin system toxin component, PIN family [candidate division NC10 bacterium]|nr:putative toxin-antitoxin system toxin component, PIN family [candidate division NC10 bacterium]MBI4839799.1 putative toxin-antitoxin system toxin component, PIN family [candidate division NC10 bacterium]